MRQGDQVVVKEAPTHHQQIIFLLHLLDQFLYLVALVSPHDEGVGDEERAPTVNGRREILHYGLFILSQQYVQPQILLMQIGQQRRPVEAEQRPVKQIQVRLEQEQGAYLALLIEVAEMVTQPHPEDQGAGYLMGHPIQHRLPGRDVVEIGVEFVEVLHMHKAERIRLLAEGEFG
ncbi:hypothetical protein D3C72_1817860 [compost metagenome]